MQIHRHYNEDTITDVFEERFTMIYKAIKREVSREITVIGTTGPFSEAQIMKKVGALATN